MDLPSANIPARSEQQAMDWSLVLLSQGIEATIDPPGPDHGWQLIVDEPERARAWQALGQYQEENQRGVWVQELPWSGVWFDWRCVMWMFLLCVIFALGETRLGSLRAAGMMDSQAVRAGEWWRLFTAVMLHGDLGHLAANVTTGIILLGLAMGSFGPGFGVLAAYLCGVCGNVAGLILYAGPHRGLGASGMVMGALGLLTAQSLGYLRCGINPKLLVTRGVAGGVSAAGVIGDESVGGCDRPRGGICRWSRVRGNHGFVSRAVGIASLAQPGCRVDLRRIDDSDVGIGVVAMT